ncbi:MAG: PKD domain-containing protein, partial [Cytophagales bacterium]|nr:PKD domain-containing protein [Cytophagales bacterium]
MENKGQWDPSIRFRASLSSGQILLMNDRIVYQQIKMNSGGHHGHVHDAQELFADTQGVSGHVISVQFLESLPVTPVGNEPLAHKTHFFYGKKGNFTQVVSHKRVTYPNLYPGIDLNYLENGGIPKYEYKISAGAQSSQIRMKYTGADSIFLKDGKLFIQTSLGEIIEQKPYAYQNLKNRKIEVPCHYKLDGNILTFEFPRGYSPYFDLIIDPALIFSTYSGSFRDNWGNTATYDKNGNMYSGGIVFGTSFLPTTPGPFANYKGGGHDAYILKFDPTGSNLLYAAYLGGSGNEFPRSMIVNNNDELVVLGTTDSPDFPVTTGAIDTVYDGGTDVLSFYNFSGTPLGIYPPSFFDRRFTLLGADMFIAKLSLNGDVLLASTYLGGSGNDGYLITKSPLTKNYGDQLRGEVIIDKNDDIYFASNTYSTDIPYING